MTEPEFDKLLRRALLDAALSDGQAALSAYDNIPLPYSTRYLRWEKKLLSNPFSFARREKRPRWKKVLRTAVIAAAVTALLFGGALAVSPTFRAWVVQWITHVEITDTTHQFENPNAGEVGYTAETLPDDVRPVSFPTVMKKSKLWPLLVRYLPVQCFWFTKMHLVISYSSIIRL